MSLTSNVRQILSFLCAHLIVGWSADMMRVNVLIIGQFKIINTLSFSRIFSTKSMPIFYINLSNYGSSHQMYKCLFLNINMRDLYILSLLLCFCMLVTNKTYSRDFKSVQLRQQKSWIYLDQMQFAPGEVEVDFWVSLKTDTVPAHSKYRLTLQMIPQNLWGMELLQKCDRPPQEVLSGQQGQKIKKQQIVLFLNNNNQLTTKQTFIFSLTEPRVYYFVLTDCDKSLVNEYFNKKSQFEMQFIATGNGKNYGYDQGKYNWLIPLLIGLSYWLIRLSSKQVKNDQASDTNWPVMIVKIILWSHITALSLFYCGHLIYVLSGTMFSLFGFIFLITSSFSNVMLLILITFCAYGWMTTFQINQNEEIFYPIASVFGFVYIILSLLSKINDGDPTKTHLYDSISTYIQIVETFIALIVFILGIVLTYLKFRKDANITNYMTKLLIFGIFCYLTMPGVVLLAEYADKHRRWAWVFTWIELMKTVQMWVLAYQLGSRGSIYSRLTMQDRSFMQHDNKYL